ncbi:ATP-dependent DNA helicase RecG [Lactobacillus sp. PV037]|uniref:ATP-dependent DNA helicase RecG n=1 Tax=Lactobacillus sp. PV037 TaxID=2594496 RepID=UPI00224099E3|nr:ATP-dependent DNA helicase RecG [Lactobacillus sp. PV037]QNQ83868.1 ATP-dependent DNA helicase RecG [Lactobacillus sp. PV037]
MQLNYENSDLFLPVTTLKGVGEKTKEQLQSLGINSIYDLLFYFPFRYEALDSTPLQQAIDGQKIVLKGLVVTDPYVSHFGRHKSRLSFKLKIDHEIIMVNFFNQHWLQKTIKTGHEIAVYGKYNEARQSLGGIKVIAKKEHDSSMAAVYGVNKNISQKKLQSLIDQALSEYLPQVDDIIPASIRKKYRLLDDKELVSQMHHPKTPQLAKLAKRSAVFREFFIFQMQVAVLSEQESKGKTGISKKYDLREIRELIKKLPFELSADQKKVVNEIYADLHSTKQMKRLLQGDVGSGKTIVALFAIYAAITAGYQVALMVPTEILAQQHFHKIDELLQQFGVRVALLTGSTKEIEKKEIYQELADGTINVVIGTHALIQPIVKFKNLGLVIIDEQHRFGVNQRKVLINKGNNPDLLAMTATPIPRTLALTVYGEMDVSEIRHLPAGRKPITSQWVTSKKIPEVYDLINKQLAQGFQVYAVTPLIHESESSDLKNAEELQEQIARHFPDKNVVLLHGQMSGEEKNNIMDNFVQKKIDILVTTSVIEVGVDVPNANMMVIYNAERFGLSQLHQLRGRIGRGQTASYCVFISDPKNEVAKKRMKIIASTSDGFTLAQEDLKLRGEGDIFGKAQSGLPQFKLGDVVNDYNSLKVAHDEAKNIIKSDPLLENPEFIFLRKLLEYLNKLQID